jgi:hypothetical protein
MDCSISLRGIARKLKVDPITVKRHAHRQELPFPRSGPRLTHEGRSIYFLKGRARCRISKDERRSRWRELRKRNPKAGTKQLRALNQATYAWLYRNDRDWLHKNLPPLRRKEVAANRSLWVARDANVVRRLVQAASELRQQTRPAVRVSIAALERKLKIAPWLSKHLSKLPLSESKLTSLIETRENFAIRRLKMIENRLRSRGSVLPRWRLARAAGIRPELLANQAISLAVAKCMANLCGVTPAAKEELNREDSRPNSLPDCAKKSVREKPQLSPSNFGEKLNCN